MSSPRPAPLFVQRVLLGLLAPIGKLLGYKARYPEYSGPEEFLGVNNDRTSTDSKASKGGVVIAVVLGVFLALLLLRWRARQST